MPAPVTPQLPPEGPIAVRYYALGGVLAAVLLNLLLRSLVKLGGPLATLLIAVAVAAGMALCFAWRQRRAPTRGERRRLVWLYGGLLGLLYLGLWAMMQLKDEPGAMGLLVFVLHYLSYPLAAQLLFSERMFRRLR